MRVKGSLLILAGSALLVMTVLLLASLRSEPARQDSDSTARPALASRPPAPAPEPQAPQRALAPAPRPQALPIHPPLPRREGRDRKGFDSPDREAVGDRPIVRRFTAPAALPEEIAREKNPAKRAELTRMHTLAVARMRVNQIQRRAMLLEQTIQRAKQDRTWSSQKILENEQDLAQLRDAVRKAERETEILSKELGVRR